jgi:hypothetical protein
MQGLAALEAGAGNEHRKRGLARALWRKVQIGVDAVTLAEEWQWPLLVCHLPSGPLIKCSTGLARPALL